MSGKRMSTLTCRYTAVAMLVGGIVLWLFTVGFVLSDLTLHDRVPDTLPNALGLLGSLMVGASFTLWTRAAIIEGQDAILEKIDACYWSGYTAGVNDSRGVPTLKPRPSTGTDA